MNNLKVILYKFMSKYSNPNIKMIEHIIEKLIEAYGEKHRVYHNLTHIMWCLDELSEIKSMLTDPLGVEVAIWFHDVVYKRFNKNNEYDSYIFAEKLLEATSTIYLKNLILATKFNHKAETNDEKYIQDIDNSILGTSFSYFNSYDEKIREEYWMVPNFIFNKNRLKILSNFMCREFIYNTGYFKEKYEVAARKNIAFAIDKYIKKL